MYQLIRDSFIISYNGWTLKDYLKDEKIKLNSDFCGWNVKENLKLQSANDSKIKMTA